MNHIRNHPFGQEVKGYIAAACLDSGILFAPPPLDFVQELLDINDYKCTKCGFSSKYDGEGCDRCGAPPSALLIIPRYFDWKEVAKRWEEIKDKPIQDITLKENLIDIHLHKLLNAVYLMKEDDDVRKQQLSELFD